MIKTACPSPLRRPRRNRKMNAIRALVQETHLKPSDLIYPLFVQEGMGKIEPITSMPGVNRLSCDLILKETERAMELGIPAVALFPVIPHDLKDYKGTEGLNERGILQTTIKAIKQEFPDICVISDVALDPYTIHGHDGVANEAGEILNDETVDILVEMALSQAAAGVDMVAPSDMMDGRIRAIREGLDREGFSHVAIHAYTAKYASAFYAPFRDALSSRLLFGDKKTYQMNPANRREALVEATLDEEEGADILMVKPALAYLDVISYLRASTSLPISAYQVSGEYAMILAAAQNGWLDAREAIMESLLCIKRAGADMIFSYASIKVAEWLTIYAHD